MNQSKYHSIDPLILQTLNLNQTRMNHILDILHGRQPTKYPKTERKVINRSMTRNKSISTINQQEQTLPPILLNRHRHHPSPVQKQEVNTYRNPPRHQSSQIMTTKLSQTIDKQTKTREDSSKTDKKQYRTLQVQRKVNKQRTLPQDMVRIQQEVAKMQEEKKQRLMKDYMRSKLKRSKSQEINPKDVYRMEIQNLVAQLTDIQDLSQSEKKMQRLKRRHKHLQTFDGSYYSKLNQHDLLVLS